MLNQQRRVILKYLGMSLFILMFLTLVIRLVINMSQGGFLLAPHFLDETVDWTIFQSNIKPISIEYPENWRASNLPQGDARDAEAIAFIRPIHFSTYPYVQIAYRDMTTPSLEDVANWGESRIGSSERNYTTDDYATTSLEKIEIGGREALLRKYNYLDYASKRANCFHIYLLKGVDAYTVEMCIDQGDNSPELQSVLERMIESISLDSS